MTGYTIEFYARDHDLTMTGMRKVRFQAGSDRTAKRRLDARLAALPAGWRGTVLLRKVGRESNLAERSVW